MTQCRQVHDFVKAKSLSRSGTTQNYIGLRSQNQGNIFLLGFGIEFKRSFSLLRYSKKTEKRWVSLTFYLNVTPGA